MAHCNCNRPTAAGRSARSRRARRSTIDGALDEEVWRTAQPAGDFVQADPHEGQPATELTEVRVAFDATRSTSASSATTATPSALVVNDIRKDFAAGEQDTFEVLLDTFADRRNGFVFVDQRRAARRPTRRSPTKGATSTPTGTRCGTVATTRGRGRVDGGVPDSVQDAALRARRRRIWGINFSRRIRRKNEVDYWSPVSRVYNLYRASLAGTLAGLPDASQGRNLRHQAVDRRRRHARRRRRRLRSTTPHAGARRQGTASRRR